jgi:GntR family transcriptional regulator
MYNSILNNSGPDEASFHTGCCEDDRISGFRKGRAVNEIELRIPQYVQVAETLRTRIQSGVYGDSGFLPPVQEFEREFQVSNITIRKAMEVLKGDGLLQRKRGVGTVVSRTDQAVVVLEWGGGKHRLVPVEKQVLEVQVLEDSIIPCPQKVHETLNLELGSPIWHMKKIRKNDEIPLSLYFHYGSIALCAGLSGEIAEMGFYALHSAEGAGLSYMEERIEAMIADLDIANLLRLRFGAPIMHVEHLFFDDTDKPIAMTASYYRGDRSAYKAKVSLID